MAFAWHLALRFPTYPRRLIAQDIVRIIKRDILCGGSVSIIFTLRGQKDGFHESQPRIIAILLRSVAPSSAASSTGVAFRLRSHQPRKDIEQTLCELQCHDADLQPSISRLEHGDADPWEALEDTDRPRQKETSLGGPEYL